MRVEVEIPWIHSFCGGDEGLQGQSKQQQTPNGVDVCLDGWGAPSMRSGAAYWGENASGSWSPRHVSLRLEGSKIGHAEGGCGLTIGNLLEITRSGLRSPWASPAS